MDLGDVLGGGSSFAEVSVPGGVWSGGVVVSCNGVELVIIVCVEVDAMLSWKKGLNRVRIKRYKIKIMKTAWFHIKTTRVHGW